MVRELPSVCRPVTLVAARAASASAAPLMAAGDVPGNGGVLPGLKTKRTVTRFQELVS